MLAERSQPTDHGQRAPTGTGTGIGIVIRPRGRSRENRGASATLAASVAAIHATRVAKRSRHTGIMSAKGTVKRCRPSSGTLTWAGRLTVHRIGRGR